MGLLVQTVEVCSTVLIHQCQNEFLPAELGAIGVDDDGALHQSVKITYRVVLDRSIESMYLAEKAIPSAPAHRCQARTATNDVGVVVDHGRKDRKQ